MIEPFGSDPVAERAAGSPGTTALVRASDGRALSYADLDERVAATAGRLAAAGIESGDHVGVLASSGLAVPRLVFAAFRLGAVAVPLNPRLSPSELRDRVRRLDCAFLVGTADTERQAVEAADDSSECSVPVATVDEPREGGTALADLDPEPVDRATPTRSTRRLVLSTSGTTGEPRGVVLTAGNLRASAVASGLRLGIDPEDRWFVPLPLYHMGGLAPIVRSTLYGTTAVLQDGTDPRRTLDGLREREATCLSVVPTILDRLLDAAGSGESVLGALRFVLSGGAATPRDLVRRCERQGVALAPTYGATETASQIATATPGEARTHPDTVGRPLFGTEVRVVDPETGARLDPGERGELVVSGPTVSPGYYDAPEATTRAFTADGYHTGDIGYRDDAGRYWVVGRVDDLIVTGGENVHPADVTEVLRSHPTIRDAFVLGLEDPEWGQRVAALVAAEGDLDPGALRDHCEGQLAGFKRPRTIAVVDELPRTASGTVDREAARRVLETRGRDL